MVNGKRNIAILIRHGESLANVKKIVSEDIDGFPLTELGVKQALKTGKLLEPISRSVDSFISSPIIRAVQTGLNVMESMGLEREVIRDDLLIETRFGKYNNINFSDFPKFHKKEYGIEAFEDNGSRMMETIKKYKGINLYFSHALPIKALICNILGLEEEDSGGIQIENSSISVVDVVENRILSIGSHHISENLINFINS